MFITQHYIAFSGWPDTRVLLQLATLDRIEKTNTLMYIPNAILIATDSKEEFFFGSFIDRDQCHTLLYKLSKVEKHLLQVRSKDNLDSCVDRQLEFGFQSRDYSYNLMQILTAPSGSQQVITSTITDVTNEVEMSTMTSTTTKVHTESVDMSSTTIAVVSSSPSTIHSAIVPPRLTKQYLMIEDEESYENISSLLTNPKITILDQSTFDFPSIHIWNSCWMYGSGYRYDHSYFSLTFPYIPQKFTAF